MLGVAIAIRQVDCNAAFTFEQHRAKPRARRVEYGMRNRARYDGQP